MRKTILYMAILALLGFSVYYFLIRKDNDSPYSAREAGFTIQDTSAIGKIFMASSEGESITVSRTDTGWLVNNKYKALPSTLNTLLGTLARQYALYPVTQKAVDNVIKTMATDATKVELYTRDGRKMRVFYVGGVAVNNSGTNMLMEGAQTPYVVTLPGFTGYLTSRYTPLLKDWRDRTVFNVPESEIKKVSVQYALKPENSFEIYKDDKDSVHVNADPIIRNGLDSPNTRRARLYLKYFTNVNCEGYLNGLADLDTFIKTAPMQSKIDVYGKHGQHWHMDSYWLALNKRSKNLDMSDPDVPDDYDADRMYAVINGGADTVLIQRFAFHNIFHKAYEFFQPDGTGAVQQHAPKNVIMHK